MVLEKQFNYCVDKVDSTIHLIVDFNGDYIQEIIEISVTNHNTGKNIALDGFFDIYFPNLLDEIVDAVDWIELYRLKKLSLEN